MAAPAKNTNAQKWTEQRIIPYLRKLDKAGKDPENCFLGQELKKLDLYRDIWAYWKQKFNDNDDIMERIMMIEGRFECNVLEAGLEGRIPARVAILTLRNAHGWRNDPEKYEIKQECKLKVVPMYAAKEAGPVEENDSMTA